MATKAKVDDVKALGFTHEMFKKVCKEESAFGEFIQAVLDENVAEVKEAIGATDYDLAANEDRIKKIEKYLAAAELWDRRSNIVTGNVTSSADADGTTEAKRAARYREFAWKEIGDLTGNIDMVMSTVVTEH